MLWFPHEAAEGLPEGIDKMNAYEFVLDLADQLIEQGREVEIEEEADSIRIYARPRNLGEHAIGANAYKSASTGRWTFCGVRAHTFMGETIRENTRRRASLIIRIYGTSHVRQEVAS